MNEIAPLLPRFLEGLALTVQITVAGALGAALVAFALGLARVAPATAVRGLAGAVIEFFRGTSAIVQLFWAFFVLPLILGRNFDPLPVALLVISLNAGAFGAEIVRGALATVPGGQHDAAIAANFSPVKRFRTIILPQALPLMIPPFGNLAIDVMKGSSVVGFLTLHDLTFWAEQARVATGESLAAYTVALVLYFALALVIAQLFRMLEAMMPLRRIERRIGKRDTRSTGGGRLLAPPPAVTMPGSGVP